MPSFLASVPPDITETLPGQLSGTSVAVVYDASGALYDIAIDELPFLLAPNDSNPYTRTTAPSTKQQLDTTPLPGEQSLSQWWTRAQESWHKGAGILFYDPGTDEGTRNRYEESVGVDVWTEGQATLHKRLSLGVAVAGGQDMYATSAIVGGADVAFLCGGGAVKRWTGLATTTYTSTPTPATRVAVAGKKILVGSVSGISSGDASGSALTVLWTTATGVLVTPYWVKSRIVAVQGPDLLEATLAGGDLDTLTPLWTHPDTDWIWTSIAESPGAILASGYGNGVGAVYAFTLTDGGVAGASPELSQAFQVASFPPGEEVHSIEVYLGTYIGIGTNRGLRVGVVDETGKIQYGPLLFETTKPVRDMTARDSFLFATIEADIDGSSGAVRVDLSQQITDLRFAWAWDVQTHTTAVPKSVAFLGVSDRVILGVTGAGAYIQHATEYETEGFLTTGRIRYATTEPKNYVLAKVRSQTDDDSAVALYTIAPQSVEVFNFRLSSTFNTDSDIGLQTSDTPLDYLDVKLVLEASANKLTTPILEALTVKALPQPKKQRVIELPLMCFDWERDSRGVKTGGVGRAWARLSALEDLESDNSTVQVRDFTNGENFRAQIQQVRFTRTQPPDRGARNFGGLLMLTLLKL